MARRFINMFLDESNELGYYVVEYIDTDGEVKKDFFETDLLAKEFYMELMSEK